MARPSPEQKKRLEANRKAKERLRDEAQVRERRVADRVQSIVDDTLARSRGRQALPDLSELLERLEEARALAMATSQPTAAVAAIMAEARLLGLEVNRSMVAVGSPEEFRAIESREAVIERLRERFGSRRADRFLAFIEREEQEIDGNEVTEGGPSDADH
jgi:hypothetical protein